MIRRTLSACSQVHTWADQQVREMMAEATHAAAANCSPADLAYYLNLAIDYLDFAQRPGRAPAGMRFETTSR